MNLQPSSANSVELYDAVRSQIEHEDNLVASRLSWLVSSQAFLFTAYAIVTNGLLSTPQIKDKLVASQQDFIFRVIPVLGLLSCLFIYLGLIGGLRAMSRLRRSVKGHASHLLEVRPAIQGARSTLLLGLAAPTLLPVAFIMVWLWACLAAL